MLRHRALVTVALVAVLLSNLMFVGQVSPPDLSDDAQLPMAARCQGGGPGCVEQPLIPPPVGGLPRFDAPAPAVFGQLVLVNDAALAAVIESPPATVDPPPVLALAA